MLTAAENSLCMAREWIHLSPTLVGLICVVRDSTVFKGWILWEVRHYLSPFWGDLSPGGNLLFQADLEEQELS